MKKGSPADLGTQMRLAQTDFDTFAAPMCPQELAAPKLHAVLQHPAIQQHVYGAKGVGSQGDGSAQLLCKSKEDTEAVAKILEGMDVKCMKLTIPARRCTAPDGEQKGRDARVNSLDLQDPEGASVEESLGRGLCQQGPPADIANSSSSRR